MQVKRWRPPEVVAPAIIDGDWLMSIDTTDQDQCLRDYGPWISLSGDVMGMRGRDDAFADRVGGAAKFTKTVIWIDRSPMPFWKNHESESTRS